MVGMLGGKAVFGKSILWFLYYKLPCTSVTIALNQFIISIALNNGVVRNKETLLNAIFERPKGVPLITVANHESCMDDPALVGKNSFQLEYKR